MRGLNVQAFRVQFERDTQVREQVEGLNQTSSFVSACLP
jgi:hypothetical protein